MLRCDDIHRVIFQLDGIFLSGVELVPAYDFSLGASLGKWAALDPFKVLSESDLKQQY